MRVYIRLQNAFGLWIRGKIGKRLALSYLIISLIPNTALTLWAISSLRNSNIALLRKEAEGVLNRSAGEISFHVKQLTGMGNQVSFNRTLQNLYIESVEPVDIQLQMKTSVLPTIAVLQKQIRFPVWTTLSVSIPEFPEIYFDNTKSSPFNRGSFFELQHKIPVMKGPSEFHWEEDETDRLWQSMSLVRPVVRLDTLKPVGELRLRIEKKNLFSVFASAQSNFLIRDMQGNEIYRSEGLNDKQSRPVTFSHEIEGTPWTVILLVPESELGSGSGQIIAAGILIGLFSLTVSLITGLWFASRLTNRVNEVVFSLGAFEEGDYLLRMPVRGSDEFTRISMAFNAAADRIQYLVDQVYLEEMERKEAQINLLQQQINPHFLYNSLSAISNMARLGRGDTVHTLVKSLAKFYRLVLSHGKDMIPLCDEFSLVRSWCEVQSVRRGDRFVYELVIDESLATIPVPKMLIQPFVENAVEHGSTDNTLHVTVNARREGDTLKILITDDGRGMEEAVLHELLVKDSPSMGFGVYYVRNRLQLQYSGRTSLDIKSNPGKGTTIEIYIPLL